MFQNQSQPQVYNFENITERDIDLISEGLQAMPWGKVNPLIQKLQMQINIQDQERELALQEAASTAIQKASAPTDEPTVKEISTPVENYEERLPSDYGKSE